ncbi:hypothetical protein [Epilithonimonas lactis]|uniref:Uncharacterized protein n=1 Tax=Epilithonimonas lactis TaxID=421072 RepID=A0A085BNB9_9FLAO|nr:hypothetical protein [Epilithonimonas lactis]KFC23964.1 hypothetical protein IO89_05255 [Epilithonimonas lactis]SEQ31998.1 hypothetical protein SAMN04488097_2030 [Epilithonimonas lactis]
MDKKAKDILFKTYWSSKGWKDEFFTETSNFEYAKTKGLMFDKLTISHDDCIKRIFEIANNIKIENVAKAFLSSLSSRRLDLRSGIASYFVAQRFAPHQYVPVVSGHSYTNGKITHTSYTCGICRDLKYGFVGHKLYENTDLNVLNFERIKWGGIRLGDLVYTFFDLEQFAKEHITEPTKDDAEIFKGILEAINCCKEDDYPSVLRDKLKDVPNLKSSKDERSIILEILACIEVLKPANYDRPTTHKNDWTYVEFWRGEDGYHKEAVEKYFGKYLK